MTPKARSTRCQGCNTAMERAAVGRPRLRCSECAYRHHLAQNKEWHDGHRKGRTWWIAWNKKNAKAWRKRNKDHIRYYETNLRP